MIKRILFFFLFSTSVLSQTIDSPELPYNRPMLGARLIPGHPLAEKMFGAWLFNERGGSRIYDNVYGISATTTNQTLMDSWSHIFGRELLPEFSGVSGRYYALLAGTGEPDYNIPDITKGLTIVAFVYVDTWDQRRIISKSADGTAESDHRWMLGLITSSGNKARIRLKTGGTTQTLVGTVNLTAQRWNQFSLRYDRATMYMTCIEEDGNFVVDSQSATGDLTSDGEACFIGGQPGGGNETEFDGQIEYIYLYNRFLSDEELRELHRDPYQLWQQPLYDVRLQVSAAVARRVIQIN